MKRKVFFLSVLFLGALFILADDPLITIIAPSGHYALIKNQQETIRWTHSDYFNTHPQNCQIYCGSFVISPDVAVTADAFVWTVGKKADGTYIPQGKYEITIESPDYDALNGPLIILADEKPWIKITSPADETSFARGSPCTIRWTHSPYFLVVPQTCVIFCGSDIVSPPVSVLDCAWEWTEVGKKKDGTWLSPGKYPITLESDDYDALSGPDIKITLLRPPFKKFDLMAYSRIPIHPVPNCPMCFRIDPRELKFDPQTLAEPATLEIVRGNQVLAKLGKFGRGLAMPAPVEFKLDPQNLQLIKSRQSGLKLHVISADGKIISQQAIQLEIAK